MSCKKIDSMQDSGNGMGYLIGSKTRIVVSKVSLFIFIFFVGGILFIANAINGFFIGLTGGEK